MLYSSYKPHKSAKDCILFPHSNDLHSGEIYNQLTTFHSFLSFLCGIHVEGFHTHVYAIGSVNY